MAPKRPAKAARLADRARLLGKTFTSMLGRYPKDLARALRRDHAAPPDQLVLAPDLRERWAAIPEGPGLTGVLWLGHCTVLLKVGGLTVLTDPVLSPIIGPRVGLGPFRRTLGPSRLSPMVALAHELPRPDLILISHAHYDHLDRPTLKALANKHTAVITAASTRSLIPRGPHGYPHIFELPWDQSRAFEGLTLSALRPEHWGARNAWDRHRGYNSYVIEGPGGRQGTSDQRQATSRNEAASPLSPVAGPLSLPAPPARILFAGDTAYTEAYLPLGTSGGVDLAILGVGAYDPWRHAHATPEQAWTMAGHAAARLLLPVHYGTFKLSNEPHDEPLARLLAAATTPQERQRLLILPPGEMKPLG